MQSIGSSLYHRILRISALVLALLVAFDRGVFSPITKQLSHNTQLYVATVICVGAAVEPTPLNTYTAALTARERELDAREAAFDSREITVGLNTGSDGTPSPYSTYILSALLFIILVLIVCNYILDFWRDRQLYTMLAKQK